MGAMQQILVGVPGVTPPPSFTGGTTATVAPSTATTNTVSLTGLAGGSGAAAAANDLVIVAYDTGSTADRTLAITDGTNPYTLVGTELFANGTVKCNLRVAYKFMGGTPDATVSIGPTGDLFETGVVAIHVWRNINQSTTLDVAATTATGTGTDRANPPSITPITAGAIIIAVGGGGALTTGANFTSGDLSNFITTFNSVASSAGSDVGMGSKAWTSGAFDPAAFGGGHNGVNDSWCALTMALRPA